MIFSIDPTTQNYPSIKKANTNSTSSNNNQSAQQQQPGASATNQKPPFKYSLSEGEQEPQKQFFEELLHKLDTERQSNADVYCDEKQVFESSNYNDMLYGVHAASKMSDIVNENIFIELINSQVKLSLEEDPNKQIINQNNPSTTSFTNTNSAHKLSNASTEGGGSKSNLKGSKKTTQFQYAENYNNTWESGNQNEYLIISAAKANVIQRVHKPVWKSQRLLDKTSWSGSLEAMQYFATLNYFGSANTAPTATGPNYGNLRGQYFISKVLTKKITQLLALDMIKILQSWNF